MMSRSWWSISCLAFFRGYPLSTTRGLTFASAPISLPSSSSIEMCTTELSILEIQHMNACTPKPFIFTLHFSSDPNVTFSPSGKKYSRQPFSEGSSLRFMRCGVFCFTPYASSISEKDSPMSSRAFLRRSSMAFASTMVSSYDFWSLAARASLSWSCCFRTSTCSPPAAAPEPPPPSISFNLATSAFSISTVAPEDSSFFTARVLMAFTDCAKRSVDMDSS
mmetsp:Transcript_36469/g.87690  ORF Transcript_36469/g.87690 Transcript_36469/m.87690 type:complete len:221 (-) Transcript_36469:841-1503(-)